MSEESNSSENSSKDSIFWQRMLKKNPNINLQNLEHFMAYSRDSDKYESKGDDDSLPDPEVQDRIYKALLKRYTAPLNKDLVKEFETEQDPENKQKLMVSMEWILNDAFEAGLATHDINGLQDIANNFTNMKEEDRERALEIFLNSIPQDED